MLYICIRGKYVCGENTHDIYMWRIYMLHVAVMYTYVLYCVRFPIVYSLEVPADQVSQALNSQTRGAYIFPEAPC